MQAPLPWPELAALLLRLNVALSAVVLIVAAARLPARRRFGPETAYGLWSVLPVAALGAVLTYFAQAGGDLGLPAWHVSPLAFWLWLAGGLATAGLFGAGQARFAAAQRAGRAGPAVIGLISPRIVMPADDGQFSEAERELMRAHEREHVARKDTRAVAFMAALQCLFWFNPLIHLAAALLRLDQELACDAAVVRSRPGARGLYARTLLKTQLAGAPLPIGCYWPARGVHPLEVRVALLKPPPRPPGGAPPRAGPMGAAPVDAIRP